MKPAEFSPIFQQYLTQIQEAKKQKLHHDQLRNIFISFLSKAFPALKPEDVLLEKNVIGAQVRGYIDALYQEIVFEFKRDLNTEREKGIQELTLYLSTLS